MLVDYSKQCLISKDMKFFPDWKCLRTKPQDNVWTLKRGEWREGKLQSEDNVMSILRQIYLIWFS